MCSIYRVGCNLASIAGGWGSQQSGGWDGWGSQQASACHMTSFGYDSTESAAKGEWGRTQRKRRKHITNVCFLFILVVVFSLVVLGFFLFFFVMFFLDVPWIVLVVFLKVFSLERDRV